MPWIGKKRRKREELPSLAAYLQAQLVERSKDAASGWCVQRARDREFGALWNTLIDELVDVCRKAKRPLAGVKLRDPEPPGVVLIDRPHHPEPLVSNLLPPSAHLLCPSVLSWGAAAGPFPVPAEADDEDGAGAAQPEPMASFEQRVVFFPGVPALRTEVTRVYQRQADTVRRLEGDFLAHWPSFSDPGWRGPRVLLFGAGDGRADVRLYLTDFSGDERLFRFFSKEHGQRRTRYHYAVSVPPLGQGPCAIRLVCRPPEGAPRTGRYDCTFFAHHLLEGISPQLFATPRTNPTGRKGYSLVVGLDIGTTTTCVRWHSADSDRQRGGGPKPDTGWRVLAGSRATAARYGAGEDMELVGGEFWPSCVRWRGPLPDLSGRDPVLTSSSGFPLDESDLEARANAFPTRLALACDVRGDDADSVCTIDSPPFKWPDLLAQDAGTRSDEVEGVARVLLRRYLEALFWTLFAQWLRPMPAGGAPAREGGGRSPGQAAYGRQPMTDLVVANLYSPGVPFGARSYEEVLAEELGQVLTRIWNRLRKVRPGEPPVGPTPPAADLAVTEPMAARGARYLAGADDGPRAKAGTGRASRPDRPRSRRGARAEFDTKPGVNVVADLGGLNLSVSAWLQPPEPDQAPVAGFRGFFTLGGELFLNALALVEGHRTWSAQAQRSEYTVSQDRRRHRDEQRRGLHRLIRTAGRDGWTSRARRLRTVLGRRAVGLLALFTQAVRAASPRRLGRGAPVSVYLVGQGWKLLHLDEEDRDRVEKAESAVFDGLLAFLPDLGGIAKWVDGSRHVAVRHVDKELLTEWLVRYAYDLRLSAGASGDGERTRAESDELFRPLLGIGLSHAPQGPGPPPPSRHLPYFTPHVGQGPLPWPMSSSERDAFLARFRELSGWRPDEVAIDSFQWFPDRAQPEMAWLENRLAVRPNRLPLQDIRSKVGFEGSFWSYMSRRYGASLITLDLVRQELDDGEGKEGS